MKHFWNRLRNGKALFSAYRNVSTLTGDDLASEPMFAQLREFAAVPAEPGPIPVGLIREFNASQKRARARKKFRFGAGALSATIILFPGLAYAGVLPTSVARVVQRIFDATSVPIQIPSVTTQSARTGETAPKSDGEPSNSSSNSNPETQMPKSESTKTSSDDPSSGSSSSSENEPSHNSKTPAVENPNRTSTEDGVSVSSDSSDDDDLVQGTATGSIELNDSDSN